jgi:hypothetical protein
MAQRHQRDEEDLPEPPQLRRLRRLVSLLMLVLIGGMVVVAAAMVIQLGALEDQREAVLEPISAESFLLPDGAGIVTIGHAPGEVLMVTRAPDGSETLRVFDAASGGELSATPIRRE